MIDSTGTGLLRTDVQDLVKSNVTVRGIRDWEKAEVLSETVFIVDGFLRMIGDERPLLFIAANFYDALSAFQQSNNRGVAIYLFANGGIDGYAQKSVFGKIEEVIGGISKTDLLVRLEGGVSLVLKSKCPAAGAQILRAKRLYPPE